jgi:hypothetical protein
MRVGVSVEIVGHKNYRRVFNGLATAEEISRLVSRWRLGDNELPSLVRIEGFAHDPFVGEISEFIILEYLGLLHADRP